jgi:putative tricarboxylic transport membrane protein
MGYKEKVNYTAMLVARVCTLLLCAHPAFSQTPYYAGKTITIVRGGGAGGSGEFQSRALMPFLKKYIPGNPTIVMEFMDGGAGRKAANYLCPTRFIPQ